MVCTPIIKSNHEGEGEEKMVKMRNWRRGSGRGAPESATSIGGAHVGAAVAASPGESPFLSLGIRNGSCGLSHGRARDPAS